MIALVLYAALCGLVFAWGREIYGVPGALAAIIVTLTTALILRQFEPTAADIAASCLLLAAAYTLTRCLLQPSFQAALLAGVAMGGAQLVRYAAVELYAGALLMLGARVATAERTESRRRVLHAGVTSLLVAAVAARLITGGAGAVQQSGVLRGLPLMQPQPEPPVADRAAQGEPLTRHAGSAPVEPVATVLRTPLPLVALVLMRPWRRQRRYTDLVLLLPVVWSLVDFRVTSSVRPAALVAACPFLALLMGANWDYMRSRALRVFASLLLAAQSLAAVLQGWG